MGGGERKKKKEKRKKKGIALKGTRRGTRRVYGRLREKDRGFETRCARIAIWPPLGRTADPRVWTGLKRTGCNYTEELKRYR